MQPLADQIALFLPRLLTAIVLIIVAFIIAAILRAILQRAFRALRLDERLHARSDAAGVLSPSKAISEIVFWLVIILFLPAILDALGMTGLLAPVQAMVNQFLAFLPNLLAAALILIVGVFIARLVRDVVTNLLAAAGADSLGERLGMTQRGRPTGLSGIIGYIIYVLILILVITAALNVLGLTAITAPLTDMLNAMFTALPNIFAAAILLILAYVVARLVTTLVTGLLSRIGFDNVLVRIGLRSQAMVGGTAGGAVGGRTPSEIVGYLLFIAIMLFASIEAARLLGFTQFATLITGLTVLLGQIVMGLIIFGIGLFLANVAYRAILDTGMNQAILLAWVARVAILVLTLAMALREFGLAPEIINLAFGLTLGAVAVAAALAFGLGGREAAARILNRTVASIESRPTNPPLEPPASPRGPI